MQAQLSQCLGQALAPGTLQSFQRHGYAVVDNVFGESLCAELLREIKRKGT